MPLGILPEKDHTASDKRQIRIEINLWHAAAVLAFAVIFMVSFKVL